MVSGALQLQDKAQVCCPHPSGAHLSFLLKYTGKSPCSLWSSHLSVKSLKSIPLPLQQVLVLLGRPHLKPLHPLVKLLLGHLSGLISSLALLCSWVTFLGRV